MIPPKKHRKSIFLPGLILSLILGLSACAKQLPPAPGPHIDAGSIPQGTARSVPLQNGAEIVVHNLEGTLYYEVEAAFSPDRMAGILASAGQAPSLRATAVDREIDQVLHKIRRNAQGVSLHREPSVGYFTFLMPYNEHDVLGALKELRQEGGLLFSPVIFDRSAIRQLKDANPASEGLTANGRTGNEHFSGLNQIRAPEFARMAAADIGEGAKVDGSSVKLGITDTGITWNHPTFLGADGKNRVRYMRDFTREGRVYFHPQAQFSVTEGSKESELLLTAEVILTPKVPSLPLGDRLQGIQNKPILVSPELRQKLMTPGSGAKFGVLLEESISAPGELADINNNGKADDKLPMILIPGATPAEDVVYFDPSGRGDFSASKPLRAFNRSGDLVSVYSEKVGFDLREDELPASDGRSTVAVRSASIVGYDPGNHGSHVAGIAAGRKTIANDSDDTLARGVAPEAQILMNRVCSNNSGCNATQAIIDLAQNGGAEVINMSLGGLSPFNDGSGVQEAVINRLTSLTNTLFVISAGNSGPGRQTVGSPSTARLSLSVGASASKAMIERQYGWPGMGTSAGVDGALTDDFMLFFSSRGPTASGGFKPNVAAPGTELSAVQLNTAPGARSGLDVYWGTSMAAPTATGAYALLLDGIKKYNASHPAQALPSDAVTLRNVLIETARPFDVTSLEVSTGAKSRGQYTWIDQGTGVIDLVSAWKKLQEVRDSRAVSPIRLGSEVVEPDFRVMTLDKSPSGIAFNGSRAGGDKQPVFGAGVYIDYYGSESLRQVHIARRIPERLAQGSEAGNLNWQLATTADTFQLRTVIHGSDKQWLRVGTLDSANCEQGPVADLTVLGRGADVRVNPDGTGSINAFGASQLNLCIDRQMIANELPPGDNGALIYAYRKVGNSVSPVASFVVPVYVTVPHKTLAGASAYEVQGSVASFGIARNYVTIPQGASVVRVTLTVPEAKRTTRGTLAPGENCQGVELMALTGSNVDKPFESRSSARISNCTADGSPMAASDKRRTLSFTKTNPTPGIWDLHVFGQYKFVRSNYTLRVDYVVANADVEAIAGNLGALNGSFHWSIADASIAISPDSSKSSFELKGLRAETKAQAQNQATVPVENPLGLFRRYDAAVRKVEITTGGSPGNDLDLRVLECDGSVAAPSPNDCDEVGTSGGPNDQEKVAFAPKPQKSYLALVDGYDVKGEGNFTSTETVEYAPEKGNLSISGSAPSFGVSYGFSAEQLAASRLVSSPLFTSGSYALTGALTLKSAEEVVLDSLPVSIKP